MALTVNTNIASITTQGNLTKASTAQTTSMQRLSSGLRINSAKAVSYTHLTLPTSDLV